MAEHETTLELEANGDSLLIDFPVGTLRFALADVARVMAGTEQGRAALVEAMRAQGWTCCPPGSQERWHVESDGLTEPWLGAYSTREDAERSLLMTDRHTGQRIPGRYAVRYVRDEEPRHG